MEHHSFDFKVDELYTSETEIVKQLLNLLPNGWPLEVILHLNFWMVPK